MTGLGILMLLTVAGFLALYVGLGPVADYQTEKGSIRAFGTLIARQHSLATAITLTFLLIVRYVTLGVI